jgi:hypothetical protein
VGWPWGGAVPYRKSAQCDFRIHLHLHFSFSIHHILHQVLSHRPNVSSGAHCITFKLIDILFNIQKIQCYKYKIARAEGDSIISPYYRCSLPPGAFSDVLALTVVLVSKGVFSLLISQNIPLVLVRCYQRLYHHASNAKYSISHRFFFWKISAWRQYRQWFLLGNSCRKKYSAVLPQQR